MLLCPHCYATLDVVGDHCVHCGTLLFVDVWQRPDAVEPTQALPSSVDEMMADPGAQLEALEEALCRVHVTVSAPDWAALSAIDYPPRPARGLSAWANRVKTINSARALVAGDAEAMRLALQAATYAVESLPERVACGVEAPRLVEFTLGFPEAIHFPRGSVRASSGGVYREKRWSVPQANTYCQRVICSAMLRFAREALALPTVEHALVHAEMPLVSQRDGELHDETIISVHLPRTRLAEVSFDSVDPVALIAASRHHMKFTARKGFEPVGEIVDVPSLDGAGDLAE